MSFYDSFKSKKVRIALAVLLVPVVLQAAILTWIMLARDATTDAIIAALNLDWFSWPSIRNIVDETSYDRMRLSVAVSLAFGIAALLLNFVLLRVFGDSNARKNIEAKLVLMSLAFLVVVGVVLFVFPNTYVSKRVGISAISGILILPVFTMCISFIGLLPLMALANLFGRLFRFGEK